MKLPEIRKLEELLIASSIPYRVINFREGCKIVYQHQTERTTAVEYGNSHGLELLDENRIYSILTAEDVFAMIKEQYERNDANGTRTDDCTSQADVGCF